MRLNTLGFIAGVCLLQQQAELPDAGSLWLLIAITAAAFLLTVGMRAVGSVSAQFGPNFRLFFLAAPSTPLATRLGSWRSIFLCAWKVIVLAACCAAGFAWAA